MSASSAKACKQRHFDRLLSHVNITPLLAETEREDAWLLSTARQDKVAVQREANAIPLRGLKRSCIYGRRTQDVHESRDTSISRRFPVAMTWLEGFARQQSAELGRAKLVRLSPGAVVYEHVDRGEYYELRDRFHLVLRSAQGSPLRAGSEEAVMREGELWWFDNKQPHEAYNPSDVDRIHLIFDLLPIHPARARSRRQLLAPLVAEDTEPLSLEDRIRQSDTELAALRQGILWYVEARRKPPQWSELLQQHGKDPAEAAPFRALASLLLPDADRAAIRRVGRAMSWVTAQLEVGDLQWGGVELAIERAGGLGAVADAWQAQRRPG